MNRKTQGKTSDHREVVAVSGLKTAVLRAFRAQFPEVENRESISANREAVNSSRESIDRNTMAPV